MNVITLTQMANDRPDLFSYHKLAWIVRHREHNGLQEVGAVLKIGRRLYLNKDKFFDWFMAQTA